MELLNSTHITHLIHGNQGEREAFGASATRPSNAVNMHLRIRTHIHVDHSGQFSHIQAPGCHIGRHQDVATAVGKLHHDLIALALLKFDDKEGRAVFWHSSAHVLGECLECKFGAKLCIGPPTEEGFYYDAYMGSTTMHEDDYAGIKAKAEAVCKEKQPFERIVLTKDQALRLFADNPFKVQLISTKIPDGGYTTAYRCGPLIDLCRGPHVPTTGAIKAFEVTKTSSAYWLGNVDNDTLQRVYGVSFPDPKQMKAYLLMVEEAKKRDHRVLGIKQELFFFHDLSPGSCFFMPHGARIYNKLMDHIKKQYRVRGYHEVVTPNMFNIDLWRISGHADHYLENMFTFKVEGADFGLKPMNCPGRA